MRAEQRDDRRRPHLIKILGNGDFGHEADPWCPRVITNRNDPSDWAPIPSDDELFVHEAGQVRLCFVHVHDPNHVRNPSSPRPIGLVCLVYLACGSPPSGAWPLRHRRDNDRSDPGSATPATAAACPLPCTGQIDPLGVRESLGLPAAEPTATTGTAALIGEGSPCWQYSQLYCEYVQGDGVNS